MPQYEIVVVEIASHVEHSRTYRIDAESQAAAEARALSGEEAPVQAFSTRRPARPPVCVYTTELGATGKGLLRDGAELWALRRRQRDVELGYAEEEEAKRKQRREKNTQYMRDCRKRKKERESATGDPASDRPNPERTPASCR